MFYWVKVKIYHFTMYVFVIHVTSLATNTTVLLNLEKIHIFLYLIILQPGQTILFIIISHGSIVRKLENLLAN